MGERAHVVVALPVPVWQVVLQHVQFFFPCESVPCFLLVLVTFEMFSSDLECTDFVFFFELQEDISICSSVLILAGCFKCKHLVFSLCNAFAVAQGNQPHFGMWCDATEANVSVKENQHSQSTNRFSSQ